MEFKPSAEQSVENAIADIPVQVISITEDNLKCILLQHKQKLGKKKDILSSISLLVTLFIVDTTATFSDFICKPDVWHGIFITCTIISAIYTYFAYKDNYNFDDNDAVNSLIDEIKKSKSQISYGGVVKSAKINHKIEALPSEIIKNHKSPDSKQFIQNISKKSKSTKKRKKR